MHPYAKLPQRQFWSRGVARQFVPAELGTFPTPLLRRTDQIVTAGSCFAANLVPYLEQNGFQYLRTEYQHPIYAELPPENMSYGKFSAAYGNIYTARQMHQLLLRCLGRFKPVEDRWVADVGVIDPFRPGLRYRARSEREFDILTARHLAATLKALSSCDVMIFTLGLTEAWISKADGAVFPACPGTVAGAFDASKHAFVNFKVDEVIADTRAFISDLRALNPKVRVILTVSPVPLVATASSKHVLAATIYSKSVLRVAAETMATEITDVHYFPAYEIVTGPQAPEDFFEADRRNVTTKAVQTVMGAFLANCETDGATLEIRQPSPAEKDDAESDGQGRSAAERLSARLSAIECEEAGQDA